MSFIRVLKPGLQTTVQDRGRWGWQAYGVSVAGPMDSCAFRNANAAAGNAAGAAALEITLLGPELEFEDVRVVASAGAAFELTLDGRPVPADGFEVRAGSRLRFGARLSGARAYLAVSGGIAVPEILGSRSTHVVSRLGGFAGRALAAGDRIPLGAPAATGAIERFQTLDWSIDAASRAVERGGRVRVVPGPHTTWFDSRTLTGLSGARYVINAQSDRMGYRLDGPPIAWRRETEMISGGTTIGALQVTRSGSPILLMADRQTSGGYPVVATVISADISVAGQLAPGDSIEFALCSVEEALRAARAQEEALQSIEREARA